MTAEPRLAPRPPLLSSEKRLTLYAVSMGVWATGVFWLALHYLFFRETPFGPAPHALEYWSRASHGAFAFTSLVLFGMLWGAHIPAGWRSARRRWTGSITLAFFTLLVVSGYLLYYVSDDFLLSSTAIGHWGLGLAAPFVFLMHRLMGSGTK